MRKITFLIALMFVFGFSMAQTIENFESLQMNLMLGEPEVDLSSLTVIPNPDPSGINTSTNVVKYLRDKEGVPWGGFWAALPTPIDITTNKYVHVKVWKSRISPLKFKLEGGDAGTLEIFSITPQQSVNTWEDIVFDFSEKTGTYPVISFMPDFEDPLTLEDDIIIYFDDIYVNNDPTPGSDPVEVIEDYDFISMNYMGEPNPPDESSLEIFPNPDKSGINFSDYVIKFERDMDGLPWGGFWSALPTPLDITTNKYMHVKVWKPRISPIKFKIEGGEIGTVEIFSTQPQTLIGAWEDIVFDLSAYTGTHPTIAFMPDFEDPLALTEDIVIYFDDFILSNDPNPIVSLTLNVDMSEAGLDDGQKVFLSGDMGGIYGNWDEPGSNPNNEMLDPDGDNIYSITLQISYASLEFKFFKGSGWDGGDPVQMEGHDPGNRSFDFTKPENITYIWGVQGVLSVPANPLIDKIKMYPNPVSNELVIETTADISNVTITSMLGQNVRTYQLNNSGRTSINTNELSNGLYFVAFYGKDGSRLVQKLIKY